MMGVMRGVESQGLGDGGLGIVVSGEGGWISMGGGHFGEVGGVTVEVIGVATDTPPPCPF